MNKYSVLSWILAPALVIGSVVLLPGCRPGSQPASSDSPLALADLTNQVTALRTEVERLKGLVPDQAHAMADVGYHFANLWFAVAQTNWPLADFYLGETRSHLLWAIRIRPVRQIQGVQLDLGGVLDAVDKTDLATLKASITSQDTAKFTTTYRRTLEACYGCHKVFEKPFIRPQIPNAQPEQIINPDPNAQWPR
jgi:hypothetical protein